MSYFATALNELMEKHHINQTDVAARSGITQTQISRLLNAQKVRTGWISNEDLERFCKVFALPIEQAKLMQAHLLDIKSGPKIPGAKLVEVTIIDGEASLQESVAAYHTKLPPKLDKDIQIIVENLRSSRLVRDMISSLAVHLRRRS